MNLFEFIIIVSSFVFVLLGIDLYKRKKFNFFHFLVFIWGGIVITLFALDNNLLNTFGSFFGIARGADLLVYFSIIILFYLVFSLLNKNLRWESRLTILTRAISIGKTHWNIVDNIKIVLIMPAYNEWMAVLPLIKSIINAGYWLIFVDDGSKSQKLYNKVVEQFSWKNVVAIRHIQNLGQGWALQTWADYVLEYLPYVEYVGHFDSDGQHRLQDLDNFLQAFQKDPTLDIVLWSRFLWSTVNMPKNKKRTLKAGILFTWLLSGIKLTDTHNGYRLMKRETLNILKITMNNMAHASEIIDIIKQKKLKYTEVPVTILYTPETISKWQKISNAMRIAKKIIYKKLFFS